MEYGDLASDGTVFKRLGYLLKQANAPVGALTEACRARRTSGINDLDRSVNANGPILSAWGIRLNVDLDRARPRPSPAVLDNRAVTALRAGS